MDEVRVLSSEEAQQALGDFSNELIKSELDAAMERAEKRPRSLTKFRSEALTLATIDQETAEDCVYNLERSDKTITGPSIRFAEILAYSYTNMRVASRVISNNGKEIVAVGIAYDLEKNNFIALESRRSILQNEWVPDPSKKGKRMKSGRKIPMSEDMQTMTGNVAAAIALRNAILKLIPKPLYKGILAEVDKVASGSEKELSARRESAIKYLVDLGVSEERIFEKMEVNGVEDISFQKFKTLRSFCSAIRNNERTVADIFPEPDPTPEVKAKAAETAAEQAIKDAAAKAAGNK